MMREHVNDEIEEGVAHRDEDQTSEYIDRNDAKVNYEIAITEVVLKCEKHYADTVNNINGIL